MGKVIIKGLSKKIYLSANNYYGADLKASVFDDDIGEYIVQDVPMTENIEPVTSISTTLSTASVKDDKVVSLTDVTGYVASDRIDISGDIYRIVSIDVPNNIVTLHRGLSTDVPTATAVTKVGNMGIFKINLFITKEGYFVIQAKDTKFGLQLSDSVTSKGMSLEDMFATTNFEINQNEKIIRETSSYTILI